MKTAVMYGAGNIGRGFIGTLFSASGYRTVFVDVSIPVIEGLNRAGRYPVRILSGETYEDIDVRNVCAVDGTDPAAVAEAIAEGEILATAVGVNVLPRIVPNLVAGLRLRKERKGKPLNILICENLMDADRVLDGLIRACLTSDEIGWYEENVGLVETSIGRMVPIQTDEMKDGNPLRVCVEKYGFLPVNKAGFKGEIPEIHNMIPFDPFDFYVKRKLYIHNMGHAVCAYLGDLLGVEYVADSIADENVYIVVKNAMLESAVALSRRYGVALDLLLAHIDDLLYRFTNKALKDTCKRVGGDPKRKLSPSDRLIGAANTAFSHGICPVYISVGIAAALHRYLEETEGMTRCVADAGKVLCDLCSLAPESELSGMILAFYAALIEGKTVVDLRRMAGEMKGKNTAAII